MKVFYLVLPIQPLLFVPCLLHYNTPIQAAKDHIEKFEAKRASLAIEDVPHEVEGEGYTKLLLENISLNGSGHGRKYGQDP